MSNHNQNFKIEVYDSEFSVFWQNEDFLVLDNPNIEKDDVIKVYLKNYFLNYDNERKTKKMYQVEHE
jgi:hypothetical protein